MIEMQHRQPRRSPHAPQALRSEEPEMLGRRHEPPSPAHEARRQRSKITGRNHDDTARRKPAAAQRERIVRAWQMLDHVEQRDHVDLADLRHIGLISHA